MSLTESFPSQNRIKLEEALAADFLNKSEEISKYFAKAETQQRLKDFKKVLTSLSEVRYKADLYYSPVVVKGYKNLQEILQQSLEDLCKMTGFNNKSKIIRAFVLQSLFDSDNENAFSQSKIVETISNAEAVLERSHLVAKVKFNPFFKPILQVIQNGDPRGDGSFVDEEVQEEKLDNAEPPSIEETQILPSISKIQEQVQDKIEENGALEKPDLLKSYPELKKLEAKLTAQGILEDLKEFKQWPPVKDFKPENEEGPRVFYSEKPIAMNGSSSQRKVMVVYVDGGSEGIKPRFIYTSTTHIAVKSLPRAIVNSEGEVVRFDKGDSEDSITLKMPYQMELIEKMNREDIQELPPERRDKFIKGIVREVRAWNAYNDDYRQDTFYGRVEEKLGVKPVEYSPPKSHNTLMIDSDYARPNEVHLNDSNTKYDPLRETEKYLPAKLLKRTSIHTKKYGKVEVFFYQSQHQTHPINYMVCRVELPKSYKGKSTHGLMISTMDPAGERSNTYLTSEKYLDNGGVTMPMLEKRGKIIRIGNEGNMYMGNAFLKKFNCEESFNYEGDFIMWNFLKQIPAIKAFAAKIAPMVDQE